MTNPTPLTKEERERIVATAETVFRATPQIFRDSYILRYEATCVALEKKLAQSHHSYSVLLEMVWHMGEMLGLEKADRSPALVYEEIDRIRGLLFGDEEDATCLASARLTALEEKIDRVRKAWMLEHVHTNSPELTDALDDLMDPTEEPST